MAQTRQPATSPAYDEPELMCRDIMPDLNAERQMFSPLALQAWPGAGNGFAGQLARAASFGQDASTESSTLQSPGAGYQLCINSNVAGEDGAGATDGHAWLTLQQDDNVISGNGLWPDDHPNIIANGLDNGDASDVRTGFGVDTTVGANQYCSDLSQEQLDNYTDLLKQDEDWGYTNNCASWASTIFGAVTGVDVDADDEWLLGAESPRELGDSIRALNRVSGDAGPASSAPGAVP